MQKFMGEKLILFAGSLELWSPLKAIFWSQPSSSELASPGPKAMHFLNEFWGHFYIIVLYLQ